MDQAARYTAEHNVMEANLKIASLESRINEIVKENRQLIEENKRLRKELEQPKLNGKEVSKGLTL